MTSWYTTHCKAMVPDRPSGTGCASRLYRCEGCGAVGCDNQTENCPNAKFNSVRRCLACNGWGGPVEGNY